MEDITKPSCTSELASMPGILLGKRSDVVHALVLAGNKAKYGGYDEDCLIYVLQVPGQIDWSVIAVRGREQFPLWRRTIIELYVKEPGWKSVEEEALRIDRDVGESYHCYRAELDNRLKAEREMASQLGPFTIDEVWAAAETGRFPRGMTAQHLKITWFEPRETPSYFSLIFAHSALHLAASKGHFPSGTTFADLLDFKGKKGEDCVGWLFRQQSQMTVPAGTTAQALAGVPNARFGDYLNQAAYYGNLPPETTNAELSKIKPLKTTENIIMGGLPFKDYAAPLHFAVVSGNLLPGTSAKDLKLSNPNGPSPWDVALHCFSDPLSWSRCAQNILACPELCEAIQPAVNDDHLEFIQCLVASPQLPKVLREQFEKYPHLEAYFI